MYSSIRESKQMTLTTVKTMSYLTYIPSGELVTVEDYDDWSVTLRHCETGRVTKINSDEGLSLYQK